MRQNQYDIIFVKCGHLYLKINVTIPQVQTVLHKTFKSLALMIPGCEKLQPLLQSVEFTAGDRMSLAVRRYFDIHQWPDLPVHKVVRTLQSGYLSVPI